MLEILKVTVELCEKHNLRYVLAYGTLLGAVRHRGFIPWDDDMDIVMPRDDFEKFKEIAIKELPNPYFFQDYTTDEEYPSTIVKVRDSSTTFVENGYRHLKKMNHGIWVDIFIADYYKPRRMAKLHHTTARIFKRLLLKRVDAGKNLLSTFCRILPRRWMFKQCDHQLKKMGYKTQEKCLILNGIYDVSIFNDTIPAQFEGIKVRIPREYDKLLTQMYGNYMQLPPENDRVPRHMTEIISIDIPYQEFLHTLS